jgi:hypothetical protein
MSTPTALLVFAGNTRAQSFNCRLATVAAVATGLEQEAGAAFTPEGQRISEAHLASVRAVVNQVLCAARRFQG